jgi:hypothetical protein
MVAAGLLPAEGLVDVEQHLLLALAQVVVGEDGVGDRPGRAFFEDSSADVERLGRDPQPPRDLLEDLGALAAASNVQAHAGAHVKNSCDTV